MDELKSVTEYLRATVEMGGSDLHLSSGAPPAARIDGIIKPLEDFCLSDEATKQLIHDTLTESQRAELEDEWELDFAIEINGVGRFRGNAHFIHGHIEASFRHIPSDIPDITSLGHYPVIEQICQKRRGLILLTGVTGSGKSTTLASLVKRISETRSGVIITVEDPIEFVYPHLSCLVKQREIGTDTKSFPRALRQALRQDPDVIVVSELRDLETIRIALTAAETGHLVIATLHTVDAPQSIDRLVDVFPPDQQQQIIAQLANVLQSVVSQRLLARPDGLGRVMASEVMLMNHGIRNCIRERKIEQLVGLMEIGQGEGMHTIDESLAHLLQTKQITLQEALHNCRDHKRFESPT
ncbi:MAG: PilT/PilU family type 4a pilus ATPase [Akkermansiaceae bacterium]|nr:PilT/PilU family type 4a pilus ATPase [Akkermansiaceae bacterium]